MPTVLVTGAAGFIGSHTVEALVHRGFRVIGLDNFDPYYSVVRKRANVEEVRAALGLEAPFTLVEGDICDPASLEHLFSTTRIDAVVHLAALAGVRASLDAPQRYVDVNLKGSLALLDACVRHGVPHFVLASTSSVYGTSTASVFEEDQPADRPLAPYPASKRAAEMMAHSYCRNFGLSVTCLRFFTVYGPRARPDMMTHKLADAMCTGQPVPLYDRGRLVRDWTYVGDTVQGIVAAVERPYPYEIINLGRGQPVLLADYIAQLEAVSNIKAPVVHADAPKTDMEQTCANIDKARRLLGYSPRVSVAEGVRAFWDWYRTAVRAPQRESRG